MTTAIRGRRGRGQLKGEEMSRAPVTEDDGVRVEVKCDLCQLSFSKKDELFEHKISGHAEFYEFECGQCDDKLFGRLEELERHFKSVHMLGVTGEEVAEEEVNALEREVDRVNEECTDDLEEEEDGEGGGDHFEEDGGMELEDVEGDDDDDDGGGEQEGKGNTFKCQFCPKSYPWKSELTTHLRSHTGEKPYRCEECGQGFSVYRSMVDHQKRHNKKFEYFCEVVGCGKGFVKKQDRDRHEVKGHVPLHLRKAFKESQCDICGKNFANSTHLKIHVNAVHGNGPGYPCHLCNKSFGHQSSLRSHLQSKKHGGTGLSFRNKKKNKQQPDISSSTTLDGISDGGNGKLGSISAATRSSSVAGALPVQGPPPHPTIYPNASIHMQFPPNSQPQVPPQSILILDPSQSQGHQGQRFSQENGTGAVMGTPYPHHHPQGSVTLQDAFQMAYGNGGGMMNATTGNTFS